MLEILRRIFSFSDWSQNHPGESPPGDMLDASFDAQNSKINEIQVLLESLRRPDGQLANGIVTRDSLSPDFLPWLLEKLQKSTLESVNRAESAASEALSAQIQAQNAQNAAENAQRSAENAFLGTQSPDLVFPAAFSAEIAGFQVEIRASQDDLTTMDEDWQTSRAEAEAWARSSALWAEHMPDTLPDNAVKIMDITGDHWSSRWWANRADNAFGRLTDLYLGAWPDPPTQNLEGGPIETGSIYYDTDDQQPYVWDGDSWQPFWQPNRAATSTLWYIATAGQVIFDTHNPDQNGNTYVLDPTHPEGLDVHVNGVKLVPVITGTDNDYSVDVNASTVTMKRPLRAGDVVAIDFLLSPDKLAPGAVTVWAMKTTPASPDGTTTSFTLTPKSVSGPAIVNITRSEELLVSLDGVIQEPGVSYLSSATALTFATAPEASSKLFVTWYQSVAGSGGGTGTTGVQNFNYDYQKPDQGTPVAGQIIHGNWTSGTLRIAKTDHDGTDRTSVFANGAAGDEITVGSTAWTVVSIFDSGSYLDVDVTPAIQATVTGVQPVTFRKKP